MVAVGKTSGIFCTSPPTLETFMLDAFIIEKIERESGLRESERTPLRIEVPQRSEHELEDRTEDKKEDRGVAIIDFNI